MVLKKAKLEKSFKLYEKYSDEIEKIVKSSALSIPSFSFYSDDDVEAEIRYICSQVMGGFDPEKSSLKTYLSNCIRTRMYNFKRDNFFRLEKPCAEKKCEYYNIFTKNCISDEIRKNCPHMKKSERRMHIKKTIGEPHHFSAEELMGDKEKEEKIDRIKNAVDIIDIRDILLKQYGPEYLLSFDILQNFGKEKIKKAHLGIISEVVVEYYSV